MITFTEQEKAIILLGSSSVTAADSYVSGPNQTEEEFLDFLQRALRPTSIAYDLYDEYFDDPVKGYRQIKNISDAKKRMIKTFFIFTCTCDGPINEGEQTALDLLDDLCGLPYMSISEAEAEYKAFFGI